jgi:hypothetical protein
VLFAALWGAYGEGALSFRSGAVAWPACHGPATPGTVASDKPGTRRERAVIQSLAAIPAKAKNVGGAAVCLCIASVGRDRPHLPRTGNHWRCARAGNDHIRRLALCGCCCCSSLSRTAGSAPATSSIFVRLAFPVTSVTAWPRTPNAEATAASAAAVAWPSTARALTRTTSAPSCSPPTPGWAAPGLTRMVIRTNPVCPGRRRTGPVSPEGPSRSHLPTGRAGQAGSCRHGRAVRMQRRRALRPPRPSNQSCSLATSRAGITLSDGTTKKERTPTRRYLKSVWGVSDVAIRAFELRRRQCYLKPCVRRSRRGVTHVTCAYPFSLMLFGLASARRALVSDMSTTQNRPLTWASPKWTSDNRRSGVARTLALPVVRPRRTACSVPHATQ